jgi:transcriptional regulator with XRE-family HTH domain
MPRAKARSTDFGARLTELRKAAGYTQVELANALDTSQRMVAYYETRAEHPPAALLPQMAQALGASVEELLGIKPVRRAKKPDTRLRRRLQQIEKMDPKERRQLLQVIDAFIEREQLRRTRTAA